MMLGGEDGRKLERERTVRTVDARELLAGQSMLRLELDGQIYTLRITRNGRLILTK